MTPLASWYFAQTEWPLFTRTSARIWDVGETSLYTRIHPMSVRIVDIRDIRALYWCPDVIVSHLYVSLHIFYKQPQRIRPIWDVFQCDFCMLAKMSGVDVN